VEAGKGRSVIFGGRGVGPDGQIQPVRGQLLPGGQLGATRRGSG
jgi:hypothetical protein